MCRHSSGCYHEFNVCIHTIDTRYGWIYVDICWYMWICMCAAHVVSPVLLNTCSWSPWLFSWKSELGHRKHVCLLASTYKLPSGKLSYLWKITIFHGKIKWWFSIDIAVRVTAPQQVDKHDLEYKGKTSLRPLPLSIGERGKRKPAIHKAGIKTRKIQRWAVTKTQKGVSKAAGVCGHEAERN